MKKLIPVVKSVVLVSLLLGIESVYAETVYSDEGLFLEALIAYTTEDFEAETEYGAPTGGAASYRAFGGFEVESSPAAIKLWGAEAYGNFNTTQGGSNYLAFDTDLNQTGSDVTVTFDGEVDAVGFYYIDVEDNFSVTIDDVEYSLGATVDGESSFFGITTDNAVTTFSFDGGSTNSVFSIDDLSYAYAGASAVPVPAALWLYTSALIGLVGVGRNRL